MGGFKKTVKIKVVFFSSEQRTKNAVDPHHIWLYMCPTKSKLLEKLYTKQQMEKKGLQEMPQNCPIIKIKNTKESEKVKHKVQVKVNDDKCYSVFPSEMSFSNRLLLQNELLDQRFLVQRKIDSDGSFKVTVTISLDQSMENQLCYIAQFKWTNNSSDSQDRYSISYNGPVNVEHMNTACGSVR